MSDAIEKTAAGATRAFFGALGFILLMVGVEGMTGHSQTQLFADTILCAFGALCFYLAFFWESAKKHISAETQEIIGNFAQSRIVRFGMLFLFLEAIILSRFFEERHWPFSYPTDPSVITENNSLKNEIAKRNTALSAEKSLADQWRFANSLRAGVSHECRFQLRFAPRSQYNSFWPDLFRNAGWIGDIGQPLDSIPPGITLRISDDASSCASNAQRVLTDYFPNPPSKISPNQQSQFLSSCKTGAAGQDCVQIEINY